MKEFVDEYFIELEKMTASSAQFEAKERMADDDLDEYGPEEGNMAVAAGAIGHLGQCPT